MTFLNTQSKTIIGAAAVLGVFSFVSRLFGFIRDRILAGTFGAGDTLDAYYAAFKIPDLLFSLIVVGSLSAGFIPLFLKQSSWRFTNNVLHLTLVVMAGLSFILLLFATPFSALVAPGFSPHKQEMVAEFLRVMLVAQILLAGSTVFGSVLQGIKRFVLYAAAPVVYNIGIIIGAVWFVDWMGPIGLAWGVVLGAALHALIQLFGCLQAGYAYETVFDPKAKEVTELIKLTGPRMLGIALTQLLYLALAIFASTLGAGSVTIFQFAYNIQFFPIGIIGVSLAVAAFPTFSETIAARQMDAFRASFSSTVRQALFFLIPLTALFLILRAQIVRVVVGAGAFDWPSTILTADTLAFFALTFVPQALIFILARAFYALHDTITPLTAGLIGSLVGLISAFLFREPFGVIGLGMAYSLSAIVHLVLLWVPLHQRVGSLGEARIAESFMKLFAAGMACVLVAQFVKAPLSALFPLHTFLGVLLQGGFAGVLGLMAYAGAARLLKTHELFAFVEALQKKWFRKVKPVEAVVE